MTCNLLVRKASKGGQNESPVSLSVWKSLVLDTSSIEPRSCRERSRQRLSPQEFCPKCDRHAFTEVRSVSANSVLKKAA